jgi:hypothetical protein
MTDLCSRRVFLKRTVVSAAVLATCNSATSFVQVALADGSPSHKELLLLCDADRVPEPSKPPRVTFPGYLKALDMQTKKSFKIDMPFSGHTVAQNPKYPYISASFEKWGYKGGVINLRDRTYTASTKASDGCMFMGHSAFVKDGSILVTAEDAAGPDDSYQSTSGFLVLRDAMSLEILGKIPSGGVWPHDIRAVNNGDTIMVVNQGLPGGTRRSNLSWISVQSGTLLKQIFLDVEPDNVFDHMAVSFDHWIGIVGSWRNKGKDRNDARAVLVSPDGKVKPLPVTEEMADEILSVTFLGQSGLMVGTMRRANMLGIWDYRVQKLVDIISIPRHPMGVLHDVTTDDKSPGFIVSTYDGDDLLEVTLLSESEAHSVDLFSPQFGGRGSHLTRVYV